MPWHDRARAPIESPLYSESPLYTHRIVARGEAGRNRVIAEKRGG